jgi:hypothetical protein
LTTDSRPESAGIRVPLTTGQRRATPLFSPFFSPAGALPATYIQAIFYRF